jgi:peptide/nickel transport system ATP-binding protein
VSAPVLAIENLCAAIAGGPTLLHDVTLSVAAGEVHGLVGTSGAGKSMIGRCVLGILPTPVRITAGNIRFLGKELVGLTERARRAAGASLALIPQDPLSALNPSRRIAAQMTDVMRCWRKSIFAMRKTCCTAIRTNCPAACASAC